MSTKQISNATLIKSVGLPETIVSDLSNIESTEFVAVKNQVLGAIFNKVIRMTFDSMEWTNPFKQFDSFPIPYGSTIENIWVEMPQGYDYNTNATKDEPFKTVKPSVKTLYASINFTMQYKQTITDVAFRRAVWDEYGLMGLVNNILSAMVQSALVDEYKAQIVVLDNPEIYANGVESVTTTSATEGKDATTKIIEVMGEMRFPSSKHNKLGVETITPIERQVLIIKQSLLNKINLDFLSGVYNLSKVDLLSRIIPIDDFKVSIRQADGSIIESTGNFDFVMVDSKGFDNHVALQSGGMIYNPEALTTNHYYNLWKIIAFKYFYNARGFKLSTTTKATSEVKEG